MRKKEKKVPQKLNDAIRHIFELGKEFGETNYIISDYCTTTEESAYFENRKREIQVEVTSIIETFAC